jgi:hypothetical protein
MTARRSLSTRRTTTTTTTAARLRRAGRLASRLRRLAQRLAEEAVTLEAEIGCAVASLQRGPVQRRRR